MARKGPFTVTHTPAAPSKRCASLLLSTMYTGKVAGPLCFCVGMEPIYSLSSRRIIMKQRERKVSGYETA